MILCRDMFDIFFHNCRYNDIISLQTKKFFRIKVVRYSYEKQYSARGIFSRI